MAARAESGRSGRATQWAVVRERRAASGAHTSCGRAASHLWMWRRGRGALGQRAHSLGSRAAGAPFGVHRATANKI